MYLYLTCMLIGNLRHWSFNQLKWEAPIPVEGDFCLQGLIVSQSLCYSHYFLYLVILVWEKTVLLVKNTLHDDPLPDDGTKMLNLRVNKEESKHRVEKKPYQD